jgi:3-oxoadipate enol-lactonase
MGTGAFVQPMTERWLTPGYRERHPGAVAKLGAMIARTSVDGLVGSACAIRDMDHLPILSRIDVPALVVVGDQDVGTPVAAAEVLHREIRQSKMVVIKGAAHMPNIEQGETFNAAVLDFLDSH